MEIVAFSDLHGNRTALAKVAAIISETKPEAVVIAGDLTNFGSRSDATEILAELHAVVTNEALIVHGNCDGMDVIRAMQDSGWYAHNFTRKIGEESFHGFGDVPVTPSQTFNQVSEGAIREAWKRYNTARAIWICHAPPYGLSDRRMGISLGSTALKELVQQHRPKLYLCGHIHEGCGVSLYNAGSNQVEFDEGFTEGRFEQTFDVGENKTLVINLAAAKDGRVNRVKVEGNEITVDSVIL